ncbi:MAG: type I 3-dehydroquinate dehydratase [Candidatus Methylacidiphilales bacterium]|nr:type I 3-dehydroquinate dehydratase [Candidatus Methylacidiphilales bacterium]
MSRAKDIPWRKPCLRVGTISTLSGLKKINKPIPGADLLEIRYDVLRIAGVDAEELRSHLAKRKNPVLLTLRTTREGGAYPWKSRERVLLFESLLDDVDAIDLELLNIPLVRDVLTTARKKKRGIILSTHSLGRKLTYGKGVRWLEQFRHHRAHVYKLASLARNRKDLGVLVRLLLDHPQLRLAVMAIGPMGPVSRQILPALGSRLVYGYVDEPAAKGQPSLDEVNALLPDKLK